MAQPLAMEVVVAMTEDRVKEELALRGLRIDGTIAGLRERLFISGRVEDSSSLVSVGQQSLLNGLDRGDGREPAPLPRREGRGQIGAIGAPLHHSSPQNTPTVSRYHAPGMTAYEILRKWEIKFSGVKEDDVDIFLARIEDGRQLVPLAETDLLDCIPLFLSGIAYHWFKLERLRWTTWSECADAMRKRFGDPDFQFALREEICARSQGAEEPVSDFLTCMRNLFIRAVPPLGEEEQLSFVYRNMLPRLQVAILRKGVKSLEELETVACRVERSFAAASSYREPPLPERSLLPEFAYRAVQPAREPGTFGILDALGSTSRSTSQGGESSSPNSRLKALEAAFSSFYAASGSGK